jgi:hypothetical protein
MMLDSVLYPNQPTVRWQMQAAERIALTGLLARWKPQYALEVGVFHGGSLMLMAQFCEHIWALDIDPAVPSRFIVPPHVDLRIGAPDTLLRDMLAELDAKDIDLDFVLIDADHSTEGVRRDIEMVIDRPRPPRRPLLIFMHDSGNPICRAGIAGANWAGSPYVHDVELDFVPGQITEYDAQTKRGEVWGGIAVAYMSPEQRVGDLVVRASSALTIAVLQTCARDLSFLEGR